MTTCFPIVDVFTLQWPITQACDLHCKHCYDRSDRSPMELKDAIAVLDDFFYFCREMSVDGQISFTGGNPFLYPKFPELYQATSDRGFALAILGNPTPIDQLAAICRIEKPLFYQVSLEGLREHNDSIQGSFLFFGRWIRITLPDPAKKAICATRISRCPNFAEIGQNMSIFLRQDNLRETTPANHPSKQRPFDIPC